MHRPQQMDLSGRGACVHRLLQRALTVGILRPRDPVSRRKISDGYKTLRGYQAFSLSGAGCGVVPESGYIYQ